MVKYILDSFTLSIGGDERIPCSVPCTLASVLAGLEAHEPPKEAVFSTEINMSEAQLASKYVFLRVSDVAGAATVLVNGAVMGGSDGIRRSFALDIRGALKAGRNVISLSFAPNGSAGIYGTAEVIRTSSAVIDRITVSQKQEGGKITLGVKAKLLGSAENVRAVATLVSGAGQIYYGGLTKGKGSIIVNNPLYWWPRGLGMQSLYKLTVNLYGESEIEDTAEMRIGLCSLFTEKNADGSLLLANGVSFLPMGALYKHSDSPLPHEGKEKYGAAVASAARAGFNTLVIPLGTPTLPEGFYDMCDSHGIVAIHEISEIDGQTEELLFRSANHPSIGIFDLIGVGDRIETLTEGMLKINPQIDFAIFESRPCYPEAVSMPTDRTLLSRFGGVQKNLFCEEMDELCGGEILDMVSLASKDFLYAGDSLEFSYISRLSSSRRVCEALAKARITRQARAVFSHIGTDGFVSSSSIDCLSRWKGLHYLASRLFSQTFVYAEAENYSVGFFVSNEKRFDFSGEIEYKIRDNRNRVIHSQTEKCTVPQCSSKRLFVRELSEYIEGFEDERYLEYVLREGTSVVSHGTLLFTSPKKFKFRNPKIRAEIAGDERRFSVTLSAEAFAFGVELSFSDTDAVFSDNIIDVTSDAPIKISFTTLGAPTTAKYLLETLKIKSIYDIGKEI